METQSPETQQTPKFAKKKTFWQQTMGVLKNPLGTLSDKSKDSPLITILAIVFILQPVLSSGVGLVKDMIEVKQSLNPGSRPVTKDELDIVNTKIDFIQQLIITDMQKDAATEDTHARRHASVETGSAPPSVVAMTPPAATTSPRVAMTSPSVVSSAPKAADIRSRFNALNKRLEVVQAPLDKKFISNTAKQ